MTLTPTSYSLLPSLITLLVNITIQPSTIPISTEITRLGKCTFYLPSPTASTFPMRQFRTLQNFPHKNGRFDVEIVISSGFFTRLSLYPLCIYTRTSPHFTVFKLIHRRLVSYQTRRYIMTNDTVDPALSNALREQRTDAEKDITPNLQYIRKRNPEDKPINIIRRYQKEGRPVFVAGPMVRYSKLPFRELVREYKTDIVYSPMILAREFVRNENARLSDFTTNNQDRPLIVQVGVNNITDLLRFVEMIHPYVDGIGINCGCPIKEQVREGIGAALMSNRELVSEMVYEVKKRWGDEVCIETKIRVHDDINETIAFVKSVEKAGVDFITVHGRTKNTRSSQPADFDKIRIVKENVSVPVIANGDCFSLTDAYKIIKLTKCDGVMAVRGILNNPALFAGYAKCPWGAIEKFWDYATAYGLPFRLIQHHLSCMMEGLIDRKSHIGLNECVDLIELLEWFDARYDLKRPGEDGFGTGVSVPIREDRSAMANL